MRYDDASQTGSTTSSDAPIARPDVDALPPGSFGPATGNAISGIGTVTGVAGADALGDAPTVIVAVEGAGGPTTGTASNFQATGQYGVLSLDAQGEFNYVRNGGTPDGVQDVFRYTLSDRDGSTSSTTLTINIGQVAAAAAVDGVLNLPAGVQLSDIRVNGRDLVITMPDGTQMVIPGGAVFVPQLVIGDVQVPPANLAALLIDSEPQPAAGSQQSSGGNFATDVPPLDPGVPLGDLIPPTELSYTPPTFEDVGLFEDEEPVAGVTTAALDDDEQSGGNPGGVGDDAGGAVSTGVLPGSDGDGTLAWSLLTTGAPTGFSYASGPNGSILVFQDGNPNAVLNITVNPATGAYVVTQLGPIAHPAGDEENNINLPISYTVTDDDGDSATGTLNVNIDDDTPIALNDTDALVGRETTTDGNVITGVGTTSGSAGADSPGADGLGSPSVATDGVTGILAGTSGTFTEISGAPQTVTGLFGSLLMNPNGSYVYTRGGESARQGGTDVFTYRIIDGDGDTTTATLTITVPADPVPQPNAATAIVDDDGLVAGDQNDGDGDNDVPNNDGDGLQSTFRGTLTANFGTDGPGTFNLAAMDGQERVIGRETVQFSWNDATDTLTATIIASPQTSRIETDLFQVVLQPGGQFDVTLLQNVLHTDQGTPAAFENDESVDLIFTAVDSNNDARPGTLTITFDDDIPEAIIPPPPQNPNDPTPPLVGGLVDEDDLPAGNKDNAAGDDDPVDAAADADPTTTGGLAGSLAALFNAGADVPLTFSLSQTTTSLPALQSGGKAVLYDVNDAGTVLTAYRDVNDDGVIDAGDTTVFTLAVNPDGSWTFDLEGQLDHPAPLPGDPAFENNIDIDFSAMVIATDSDGDDVPAAAGAFVVTVDDDLPTAKPPLPPEEGSQTPRPLISGLVDEDDLSEARGDNSNGNNDVIDASDDDPGNADGDNNGTTTGGGAPSLAGLFNPGADQPLTILLSASTAGLEAQNLKSNGQALSYDSNTDTGVLTGYVESGATAGFQDDEDRSVFTLTVATNGEWEFDLIDQLDHPVAGTEDNLLIDFSSVVTAVDSDGDPVTAAGGTFVINVDDDMPKAFVDCPVEVVATNEPGTSVLGLSLNLPPVGADEPGKLTFGVSTDPANPTPVLIQGTTTPVMSNGQPLFYFINESDPTILEGRTSVDADPVFTIDLNPVTGTYDFHLIGDITSEVDVSIDVLTSIGGGNVEAKAIDVPGTPFDLILTTAPGDTINTNANFIGVTGGQALEAQDVVRIDFVQNVFTTGSGSSTELHFGEYYSVNSFRQDVGGLNPEQFASFTVTAFNVVEAGGSDPSDPADGDNLFYGDLNDTKVATGTSINIYNASGTLVNLATYNAANPVGDPDIVVTSNGDGSWTITGLPQSFDYEIVSATPFEAVQVQATATSDTFKLGVIDLTRVEQVPVDFEVPIILTDADGDPVQCDIVINLTPGIAAPTATARVDDDGLANSNPAGMNDIDANVGDANASDPADTEAVFKGTIAATGGSGDVDYKLVAPAGPVTIGQETVTISVNPAGTLLTATISASPDESRVDQPLFTVSLDAESGDYTVTLARNVLHNPAGNDEDGVEHAIGITYEARDESDDTSTGTLQIVLNDDVPDAVSDGNINTVDDNASALVIGTTGDLLGNDKYGADGPALTGAISIATGTLGGTITINASNQLVYTAGAAGDVTPGGSNKVETFSYTITDADGDTDTATFTVTLTDEGPSIDEVAATIAVDEEGLSGGIAGTQYGDGSSDLPGTDTVQTGTLAGLSFGGDGAGDIVLTAVADTGLRTLSGQVVKSVWDQGTHTLTGFVDTNSNDELDLGETEVFTLQITDLESGAYRFELLEPVKHDTANTEDDKNFSVEVTVTDAEDDPAVGQINITIDDDSPTLSRNQTAVTPLVTDDTDTPNDTAGPVSFAGLFTGAFGADGFKDANNDGLEDSDALRFSLSLLNGNGTDSGLVDVLSGDKILLRVDPATGDVEGYLENSTSTVAFTIDLNRDTGQISLEQDRAIKHNDSGDAEETQLSGSAATMAANLVVLTATIEDDDGDTRSATADVGGAFHFEDDGPSISRNQTAATPLVTDDTDTPNDVAGPTSFANLFTSDFGKDGFKDTNDNDLEDADAIRFSVSLKDGDGTDSGLIDVVSGDKILLRASGSTIEGYLENSTSTVAFTITLNTDTGAISLEQDRAIKHNDPSDAVESGTSAATMAADLIVLTATIEDGDGDTDTATADIGNAFRFEDDGPTADPDTNTVAEGATLTVLAIDGVLSDDSFGKDGPGTIVGVSANDDPTVHASGNVGTAIETSLGTLTLYDDGRYTYVAKDGVVPPAGATDIFTYTIEDADGDKSTTTLTISLSNVNQHPTAGQVSATVDDEGLAGGIEGLLANGDIDANAAENDAIENPSEAIFKGVLQGSGGDGTLTFLFDETTLEADTNDMVGTERVRYEVTNGGSTLQAYVAATTVDGGGVAQARAGTLLFTVQITDTVTGAYTLTLNNNVLHTYGDNTEASANLAIAYQVKDPDSSPVAGTLNIEFNDDRPVAFSPVDLIDQTGAAPAQDNALVNDGNANVTRLINDANNDGTGENFIGADGFGSLVFSGTGTKLTNTSGAVLKSGGQDIYVFGYGTGTLVATTDATNTDATKVVFTATLDAGTTYGSDSTYSIDFNRAIDDGSGFGFSNLSGGVAGNPPFKLIIEPGKTLELLATPINGSSINSDTNDLGVDSQFIDTTAGTDKGVRFDFGDFTYVANAGGTADDQFEIETHSTVNGFKFTIDQVSNGTTADVHLKAIDADNDGGVAQSSPDPLGDSPDTITMVKLYNELGVLVGTFTTNGAYQKDANNDGDLLDATDVNSTITFSGGEVTITNLIAGYSIQTYTANGYNRIEITNPGNDSPSDTDGKYSLRNLSIETTSQGSPVNFALGVTATDGDGDTSTGTIDVTMVPVGSSTTTTTTTTTTSSIDAPESTLLASNDNLELQRSTSTVNNTLLMGALAAGLSSTMPLAAEEGDGISSDGGEQTQSISYTKEAVEASGTDTDDSSVALEESDQADSDGEQEQANSADTSEDSEDEEALNEGEQAASEDAAEFQEDTEAAAQQTDSTFTGETIAMPSAEMLLAANDDAKSDEGTQHNAIVGKVLVDALNGGGDNDDLDALITAVSGEAGGALSGLQPVASLAPAFVPEGDMAVFAGFAAASSMPMMEQMMLHQDAAPAQG